MNKLREFGISLRKVYFLIHTFTRYAEVVRVKFHVNKLGISRFG